MSIDFYSVWKKGVPYLTSDIIPSEVAEPLGFDFFEPKTKDGATKPDQWFIEKPAKAHMLVLEAALIYRGVTPVFKKYDPEKSKELGWKEWDGYKWGFKDAPDLQKVVDNFISTDKKFEQLTAARFKCVFKKGKPTASERKFELAHIQLGSKTIKRFAKFDFVLTSYEDLWEAMSKDIQERLVYHELLHARMCGNPYLVDHDIEEFHSVYEKFKVPFGEDPYCGKDDLVREVLSQQEDA